MRWLARGLIIVLLTYLALVIFTNRALFFSTYDASYWKDKFEHSQWSLPLSARTIGDDGLYLYEGYRLIRGGNPALLNAEVPPFGKYIIGASILIFGNGYIYGFITTSFLLLAFYMLLVRLLHTRVLALAFTTILATDPLITNQFPLTMLDSLQALVLLCFLLLISGKNKKAPWWHVVLTGVTIGIFSEVKFPIMAPILAIFGFISIWETYRTFHRHILFAGGVLAGYLLPYVPYFFMGHSLLDWLRVQKWVVSFYLHTKLTPTWGSALVNLLAGRYQNIFSRLWLPASHWSGTWTLAALVSVYGISTFVRTNKNPTTSRSWFLRIRDTQDRHWLAVFVIYISLLMAYMCIPFWTRYLVLLLPLLYLVNAFAISKLAKKYQAVVISVYLIGNITASMPVLFPTPEATAHQIIYEWEHLFFQDMYMDLTDDRRARWDAKNYRRFALTTLADAEIDSIHIEPLRQSWHRFLPLQTMRLHITYYTRNLGSFEELHEIPLQKEHGRWRIPWEWDMLLDGLTQTKKLKTTVYPARRGSIIASDKKPLAEDFQSVLVSVTPQDINPAREQQLLQKLAALYENKLLAVHIHERLYGNSLGTIPIPVGVLPKPLTTKEASDITSYPGVTLSPHIGRRNYGSDYIPIGTVSNSMYFECCSLLYSTTNYDGTDGVEKEKNTPLKGINGGVLEMVDTGGRTVKTIISVEKKDGTDVQL